MSVLASKRKESKLEVIKYAENIEDMLLKLIQRNLGIRDYDHAIRQVYKILPNASNDVFALQDLISQHKQNLNHISSDISNSLIAANTIYPTSLDKYMKICLTRK